MYVVHSAFSQCIFYHSNMATHINNLDQSVVPVEEMNAEEVTETSSNLNISLTARERLMKKLQGISTMVSIAMIIAWHGVIKQMLIEVIVDWYTPTL